MSNSDLVPNVSVGQIKLGTNITEYLAFDHTFFKKDEGDLYMEDYYDFTEPPLVVFVNSLNQVSTINCHVRCFWKDVNLIGLAIDKFVALAEQEPNDREKCYIAVSPNKGQNQTMYSFEDLGLQIWTWRNKIVTVSATNYDLIDDGI